MSVPDYTEYHPRWYRKRLSTYWWLGRWPYLKFVLRELSSVAVALSVVMTLAQVWSLQAGRDAYAEFQQNLRAPLLIVLGAVCFGFVLFHTITWFNLAPRAMAVRIRGKRLPDVMIAAPNYIVWLAISGLVAWLVLRG